MFGKQNGKQNVISNVRVGKAQTTPTRPAHTPGVKRGNARGNFDKEEGIEAMPDGARANPRRSTAINPKGRRPIDPRMPNLLPP